MVTHSREDNEGRRPALSFDDWDQHQSHRSNRNRRSTASSQPRRRRTEQSIPQYSSQPRARRAEPVDERPQRRRGGSRRSAQEDVEQRQTHTVGRYADEDFAPRRDDRVEDSAATRETVESAATGKAVSGHNVARIGFEVAIIAATTALGVGGLSWAVDRLALKFFAPEYDPASVPIYMVSAGIALTTVLVLSILFLWMDRVTGAARGLFTGLVSVAILVGIAGVVLTSFSLNAIIYVILLIGLAVGLSYVPKSIIENRYV